MGTIKTYFPIPSCSDCKCPHFINNHSEKTFVPRANRRTLYWGERYCICEKKARQFGKNQSWHRVPAWCPRKYPVPVVRCYARRDSTIIEDITGYIPVLPSPKDYTLARITSTPYTPRQLFLKLCDKCTDYGELLGDWYPRKYAVLEIDAGIAQYHLFLSSEGWRQCYRFDSAQCDNGVFGEYQVLPHQGFDLNRYSDASPDCERQCIGIVQGYFAGGIFQRHWAEKNPGLAREEFDSEVEGLLFTLQTEGFLSSFDALYDFCWKRYWALLDRESGYRRFGFYVEGRRHKFYLVLIPEEESTYNIIVYCYP